MQDIIFFIGLILNSFLLCTLGISYLSHRTQIWPPPKKESKRYHIVWWCFRGLFASVLLLLLLSYEPPEMAYKAGSNIILVLFFLFFGLGSLAAWQLGWKNTHGEVRGFVATGLYKYSRNPQYVFYSISFLLLAIWAGDFQIAVLLMLLASWYLLAPFPEEKWLTRQYGEVYLKYKRRVPRYIGKPLKA